MQLFMIVSLLASFAVAFNPYKYDRKAAQCIAVRRGPEPLEMKIDLSMYELCLANLSPEIDP